MLLTYVVLIAALRRWVLVSKLAVSARAAGSEVADDGSITVANVADEVLKLREAADAAVYGLFGSLAATIPALGFLGTVVGMGSALLRADGLFSSQDKQRVVGLIAQDLGFAFDTALVSLVCAPVAAIFLAMVRLAEQRMFARWTGVLNELRDN